MTDGLKETANGRLSTKKIVLVAPLGTNLFGQQAKKVPAIRVECQTCGKDYANQKNLKNHIEKDHKPEATADDEVETTRAAAPETATRNDDNSINPFAQTEEELQAENEMMVEFSKQLDMLDEIKEMTRTESVDDANTLKDKIERFRIIVVKKNEVLKDTREDKLRLKHDVECSKQVENMLQKDLDVKDKEIDRLRKEVKAEKDNSISIIAESKNKKKEVRQMKSVIEARNKEIKDLQEKLKSDDDIEVLETRRQVQMNKTSSGSICLPCDRKFVNERDLENHINAKHQVHKCPLCEEVFENKLYLVSHLNNCMDRNTNSGQHVKCNQCNKRFSRDELAKHKQSSSCRADSNNIICRKCNAICISNNDLRKHMADDHENEKSREVCKHWKAGSCFRGDRCMFSHVGYQNKAGSSNRTSRTPCRNGRNCSWQDRGHCKFGHEENSQGTRQPQSRQSGKQSGTDKICWDNENCRRNYCSYKHLSMTDFPYMRINQNQRRPTVWGNSNQ